MTTSTPRRALLALPLALALLGGCANVSAVRVSGKVLKSDVAFIAAVDESDPRLKDQVGVAGATIDIYRGAGPGGGGLVGTGVTDQRGDFKITLTSQDAIKTPAQVRATAPGYMPAQGDLYLPPNDRRILVLVRPSTETAAPPPPKRSP